ncbi:MAG TPA: hypothetical protein VGC58_01355 [Candidatus Paceibacterota bacterium]
MFHFIERLRQKSEKTKKKVAFFTAFSFSLIIFIVWVTVIYPDFKKDKIDQTANVVKASPIDGLADMLSSGFSEIAEKIGEMKSLMMDFSSSTSVYYESTSTPENMDQIDINPEQN